MNSNRQLSLSLVHLVLFAAAAAGLSACGGGGGALGGLSFGSGGASRITPLTAAQRKQAADVLALCQTNMRLGQAVANSASFTLDSHVFWTSGEVSETISAVYFKGDVDDMAMPFTPVVTHSPLESNIAGGVQLRSSVTDMRVYSETLAPGTVIMRAGTLDQQAKMGLILEAIGADQSAGCVLPAYRVRLTNGPYRFGDPSFVPQYAADWRSDWFGSIPMQQISGYPVTAFEFLSNFKPQGSGMGFFSMAKSAIAKPDGMRVCAYAATGSSWQCEAPKRQDTATHWVWTFNRTEPGVYALFSDQSGARQ